jgi:hypothetical protein
VNDGNDIAEFALKGRVEVCAALDCAEAVSVCELREYSDVAAVFELETCDWWILKIEGKLYNGGSRTSSHG